METLTLKSYAKVNLYLKVLNTRRDHYHNLSTVFERINLFDTITLTRRPDRVIRIISSSPDIPRDCTNLAYKSARLLQTAAAVCQGADIRILKRIPVGAGLGGGSSNAACVLLGLTKLWKLSLGGPRLVALAKQLGSDVPFFVYGTSFAYGRGRGDIVVPFKAKKKLWHVLIAPGFPVLTPVVYKNWDELKRIKNNEVRLTIPKFDVRLLRLALHRHDLALLSKVMYNSLEQVTFALHPELAAVKHELLSQAGICSALMSGSGPTLLGIARSRAHALTVAGTIRSLKKNTWRVFVAQTA